MNLQEFKAWFDGFTENLEAAPTAKQWKRIKEQVAAIDGAAITYPVYVDRYVRPWYPYQVWSAVNTAAAGSCNHDEGLPVARAGFDGAQAMYLAGKREAGNT